MIRQLRQWITLRSIRHKLMAASVACLLVPAVLTLLIYNSLTQEAVKRQAISNAQDSLLLVSGSVTNLMKSMLTIANYIQVNSDLNAYFKMIVFGSQEADPYRKFTETSRVIQQLDSLTVVGEKSYVTVLLANGTYFTNYSTSDYNPLSMQSEPWFEKLKGLKNFESYWIGSSPTVFQYDKAENPYQISVARTLRLDSSAIYGYVVVTMMENQFNQMFNRLSAGQKVMLIDGNNRILSSADTASIGKVFPYAGERTGQTRSAIVPVDGKPYLITEQPISFNDWRLVSMQPYKEAIVNISSIFNRVFVFQIVSFVGFLLLLLALLRAFTKPLMRLGKVTSAVQRGNLNVRSGIRGQDEIGRLGFLFDQMLDRVQEMIAEISETQARKRKAELKMLQAQIHPHFLFNVLNSIRMKVIRRGDPESGKMIGSLSKLLRMTISREEDDICLHEELDLISHYVDLMNMRQKEPVRLALDIETEALLVRVPRFILQPIVENALIHGLNRKAGTIRIAAAPAGGALRLTVEDDGCGMDKDRLESLNRKLNGMADGDSARFAKEGGPGAGGASAGGEFSGFGLLNVVERMKMLCGDEFRMEVQSRPGEGTAVCLTIPYREGEHHV